MELKELFSSTMMKEVRPIYDMYQYGIEHGWKIENIIIAIILESLTASINSTNMDKIKVMPQVHATLENMFETKFEINDLLLSALEMRTNKSYFTKRLDELADDILKGD